MLASRFKGIAYSPVLLTPLFLIIMLSAWYFSESGFLSTAFIVSAIVFVLWLLLIFFVMKLYFSSITILPTEIKSRSFLGNGKEKVIQFNQLDGYQIQKQSGESSSSEAIVIFKNSKAVLQISDLFYMNYPAIKKEIEKKLKKIN